MMTKWMLVCCLSSFSFDSYGAGPPVLSVGSLAEN